MKTYFLVFLGFLTLACTSKRKDTIRLDGSSTVFPLSEAVSEEFQKTHKVKIAIGVSGTGGGFKRFCRGEVALIGASRKIEPHEAQACQQKGIAFSQLPIALDGIVVVVHPNNQWVSDITLTELKKLFEPQAQGKITRWNQIRPQWPNKEIHLFSPGVDSGTYDYFTQVITGKAHSSRGDLVSSEDDNVIVQGIASDPLALGFLGYAYYQENKSRLKALSVMGIFPNMQSIQSNAYRPLSRELFLYSNPKLISQNKNLQKFFDFYKNQADHLAAKAGYVPLGRVD